MAYPEIDPTKIANEAKACNQAAEALYEKILKETRQGRELEPFFTDDGERQPSQIAVALGALRQRAHSLTQLGKS